MTRTERDRLRYWLGVMKRPDLGHFLALRLKLVENRMPWHLFQVGGQHPEHDLEDWIARARARAICERAVKKRRWMLLAMLAVALVFSPPPAHGQGIDVIHVQNNGVAVGTLAGPFILNCVSTGTSPCSITNGPKTLNFAGGSGGGNYQTLLVAGTALPQEPALNFSNPVGVVCADNPANKRTDCDITYTELQVAGISQPTHNRLNFAGGITCTSNDTNDSSDCTVNFPPLPSNVVTSTGTPATGHCAQWAGGNVIQDSESACGGSNAPNIPYAMTNGPSNTSIGLDQPYPNVYFYPPNTFCPSAGIVYHMEFIGTAIQSAGGVNWWSIDLGIGATRVVQQIGGTTIHMANGTQYDWVLDVTITCISPGTSGKYMAAGTLLFAADNTSGGVTYTYNDASHQPFTIDTTQQVQITLLDQSSTTGANGTSSLRQQIMTAN